MSSNVVLLSTFDLTRLFHAVSERLRQDGHRIFWISTSRHWTGWLNDHGVRAEDILPLIYSRDDFLAEDEKKRLDLQIRDCERGAETSINQSLLSDRFVRYLRSATINEYVYLYYRDIKRFLVDHRADVVFGEPSNLNEQLTGLVCRELGVDFCAPWNMRYPPNRMIFTSGLTLGRPVSGSGERLPEGGAGLLRAFEKCQTRPMYFAKMSKWRTATPWKIWQALSNRIRRRELTSQPNLTHHRVTERVSLMLRRVVNGFYLRHLAAYTDLDKIRGKIAYFGLHVQPEHSIDVQGAYVSDQLKLIKDIRRALPFDITLVVKEHPNFLGIRGFAFQRKLRRIPNVCVVKHDVSSFDLYRRASVVFTVSGTVGYEAGMLGVPAVVFSDVYFQGLSTVYYCPDVVKLRELLEQILNGVERDFEADSHEMERLIARSFRGCWGSPFALPEIMSTENVTHLQEAFSVVVRDLMREKRQSG